MNKKTFKEYMLITVGIIITSVALEYFLIPNNIAAGGATGVAIIINKFIPAISTGPIVFIINLILFIVGFIIIGSQFGAKTIYASFMLSGVMWVIEEFFNPYSLTQDMMMATIVGGLISAVGMAIVFNNDASTGGTDIIAVILKKFFHIEVGKSLLIVDFVITFFAALAFGFEAGLYAVLSVIILGVVIDSCIAGLNKCNEVTVISNKNKEISEYIMNTLERGCTFYNGVGAYTGKETQILYSVVGRNELIKLKKYIVSVDKSAFITVREVHEVTGEGFKGLEE